MIFVIGRCRTTNMRKLSKPENTMKNTIQALLALGLLGAASASQAWWGNNGWGNHWNPYDVWDPRYWMEEMENAFDDDWYGPGPYGPYGPYGYGPYGPPPVYGPAYGPGFGPAPYGPPPAYLPPPPAYGPGPRPGFAPPPPPVKPEK